MPNRHMCPVVTALDSTDTAHFHQHKKCHWLGWAAEPHLGELAKASLLKPETDEMTQED